MSEVENNQETNGTSNGDVPEIELIIKEEFLLENEVLGNAYESGGVNTMINSIEESLHDLDEKENIVYTTLKVKQEQKPRPHLINEDRRTICWDKASTSRKNVSAKRHSELADDVGQLLTLTHYDNQHFHFEYVTPKEGDHQGLTSSGSHITSTQLCDKSHMENNNLNNRVPLSQKHIEEEVTIKGEQLRENSNLDFAAMVAEACEGIYDEIVNDLRSYSNISDTTSCHEGNVEFSESAANNATKKRKKRQHNTEAVQLATKAVLEGQMSLGKAATCFNVVRSTIASRVAKHPKRKRGKANKELQELIYSKLKAGIQISEISRSLHVPKSTVHLHKTRLKNQGLLPSVWIRNGSKDMVDHGVQERLMQAYRGHTVNGMSVRFAAEFYSLPLTTLWRYVKRKKNAASLNVVDGVDSNQHHSEEYSDEESASDTGEGLEHDEKPKTREETVEQELINQLLE
ncbi:uncharacterized protein LOC101456218 isoform X2 [Ceratitis capitata]|nr:uncharacterized protein LOC101456218 isoform X2 [Ceratitis capitata]